MSHPVTILIDGLAARQGGGQTYIRNLLLYAADFPTIRPILLLPKGMGHALAANVDVEVIEPNFEPRSLLRRLQWQVFELPKLLTSRKVDVLYCPSGTLSTRRVTTCKTAVACRNMLPFSPEERRRYPYGYTRARLWLLRFLQGRSFQDADLTIYVSKYAEEIVSKLYPKEHGNAVVIPHGVGKHFAKTSTLERLPALAARGVSGPYVLYVSILNVYKAQLEVISAWSLLRSRHDVREKLVLAGPEYKPYAEKVRAHIDKLGLKDEVILIGDVAYGDLPRLYQNAAVNLFASSCENCPNILLEILASGTPTLSSNFEPMPEFAGYAAEYFDPYQPEELARKLQSLLTSPERQNAYSRAALMRAQSYSWERSARKTWEALLNLASKGN